MIYLQITSGRGPAECNQAIKHITNRILTEGPNAKAVSPLPSSSVVSLDGPSAADYARQWIGTILWVCALREGKSRKNWYVGIREVQMPVRADKELHEEDLKWETKKASGKGGQHVNKTESAVRLTYKPLGITVISQDERSQHRNRAIALERLKGQIRICEEKVVAATLAAQWDHHNQVERGNPVKIFDGMEFRERVS